MNPSTAFGAVLTDELARCGLREVVVAPGSRSTPLAMAFWALEQAGRVRLHVRIDERSAAFTALGLAKVSGRPVAVLCTSGTAAANFHPAVIEADESAVPLLVLTADRPPELRGTGASQTIDQVKLYGSAVRWYAESGVPERRPGQAAYWRSLACRAWAHAAGAPGTLPGPVHLNLPLRDPLVPDAPRPQRPADDQAAGRPAAPRAGSAADNSKKRVSAGLDEAARAAAAPRGAARAEDALADADWPDSLSGRPDGAPWTRIAAAPAAAEPLELPWAERGVVVCGDGDYDAAALVALAEQAGWPVLAEPSSGARRGPHALTGYQYLLASPAFMSAYRPEVIVSAGRPGLTRPQSALLAQAKTAPGAAAGEAAGGAATGEAAGARAAVRHVVVASGPGLWADPQRAATDVAAAVRLAGVPGVVPGRWLSAWQRADAAATRAAGAVVDAWRHRAAEGDGVGEPEGTAQADGTAEADSTMHEGGAAGSGAAAAAGSVSPRAPGNAVRPGDGDPPGAVTRYSAVTGSGATAPPGPGALSEPEVATELVAALPEDALLWCGNSLSVRDVDLVLPPRADTRVIASRGVSGIDGTFSTAAGAAMAHAAEHPGAAAFALIGDLSLLHDAPGLGIGPAEPRPDLCVVVVNNDGGGIFEDLEPARFKAAPSTGSGVPRRGGPLAPGGAATPSVFERVFGTAHGASIERLAAAFGLPWTLAECPGDLAKAMAETGPGAGPRIVEVRTDRGANAALRNRMRAAAVAAAEATMRASA